MVNPTYKKGFFTSAPSPEAYLGDLKSDGTVPLTADWNVGNYKITSPSIVRGATLTIASATSKTQNADYCCDGTADEVQINAAIQALDGTGGRIVLMEGTFYINAAITYTITGTDDNDIVLEGQGDATILKIPDSHATSFSVISVTGTTPTLKNLQFKNFKIDGNKASAVGSGAGYNGILLTGVDKVLVENVSIVNCVANGYGVAVSTATELNVSNSYFNDWGTNGIEFRATDRAFISNCFFNTSRVEIYSSSDRLNFSNNIFYETSFAIGTDVGGDIDGISFTGNTFYNPTLVMSSELSITNAYNVTIFGNNFNCKCQAVWLTSSCIDAIVSGNIFTGPASGGNYLQDESINASIIGNKFVVNTSLTAIEINDTSTNCSIKNNAFSIVSGATSTNGIVMAGAVTNCLITGNTFQTLAVGVDIGAAAVSAKVVDNIFNGITNFEMRNQANTLTSWTGKSVERYQTQKFLVGRGNVNTVPGQFTGSGIVASIPAKTKIVAIYAEQLDGGYQWAGTGLTSCLLSIGKSAGGKEYLSDLDVMTAAKVFGLAETDLGTELVRTATIQGGAVVNWTAATNIYVSVTTGTIHTDDLTAGLTWIFIVTETYTGS